nr:MAG TPA: hypothetical protein [Bacteriophage sp.]
MIDSIRVVLAACCINKDNKALEFILVVGNEPNLSEQHIVALQDLILFHLFWCQFKIIVMRNDIIQVKF